MFAHTFPATDPSKDDVVNLSEVFRALWRSKFLIAAISLVFLCMGGYYAYFVATPKYRATTVLLLDTTGQKIVDLGVSIPSLGSDKRAINTEVEVIRSRGLLHRVAEKAGLINDPEFNGALRPVGVFSRVKSRIKAMIPDTLKSGSIARPSSETPVQERVVNALLNAITARNVTNTDVLQITVETEQPAKSAFLADEIARQYIQYQVDVKFEATQNASRWLSDRVADLKQELEQAEARLASYSTQTDVLSKQSVQGLERQLKELRVRYDAAVQIANDAQENADHLNALATAPTDVKAEALDAARPQNLEQKHSSAEETNAQFARLLDRAQQTATRAQNQVDALSNSITALEAQITTQSQQLIEMQQLSRDAEATRLLYEYFLGRLKENAAQEGIQQPDSRILSKAVAPTVPSAPRKSLILTLSMMLGFLFSCGFVLARSSAQNSYRSAIELERTTGLPVVGQVPRLPVRNRKTSLEYLTQNPMSPAAEAIRNLRTSVLLSNVDTPPQVILSTSSVPNEGKTLISFALAHNLVGLGKKVLLIEGDIRRLIFSEYFEAAPKQGFLSVLSGTCALKDAVFPSDELGCDILISEPSRANAADLLSSEAFETLLNAARKTYDHIVIDSPPALVVPDPRIIAQKADLVLFTVQWNKTQNTQIQEALRLFAQTGRQVDGLVLNQIDEAGMKRYGYGDRSYGKHYYSG